jgi:sigma-B regulation protein RsbU (phosphoserine phosphatase)
MAIDNQSHIAQLELQSLLEVTQAINQNLPEANLYKIFRFTLLANLYIEQIALYAPDAEGNWENKILSGPPDPSDIVHLQPFLDCKKIKELKDPSIFSAHYQYVIPVPHKDSLLALVFLRLNSGKTQKAEAKEALRFVQLLANVLMVAIENKKLVRQQIARETRREALRKELEIARLVQNNLFPRQLPREGPCICEASYLPHEEVGGDYYDFLPLENGSYLLCIADVSGKGVPAALLMSNFQASLRTLARRNAGLKEMIAELNFLLKKNGNSEHFITVFLGLFQPETNTLSYINAGHNPPLLIQENGATKVLEAGTTVLGIFDPLPFDEEGQVRVHKGDLLFAYTDGLVETMNTEDEMYGLERLLSFLEKNHGEALPDIHQGILEALRSYKSERPFTDDLTMLSCRFGL